MARLLADENFPLPVVQELRRLEHDVATTAEAGPARKSLPDTEILDPAASDGRAVLTLDRRDFIRLHEARPDHAGIIACTLHLNFVGQAGRIHAALEARGAASLTALLLRVNRPRG